MRKKNKQDKKQNVSLTINQRRWKKFKGLKRGYYSFLIIVVAYALSFLLPLLVNDKALAVRYNGEWHFPAFRQQFGLSYFISGDALGQAGNTSECNYRQLKEQYNQQNSDNIVIMPLYPYGPLEAINVEGNVKNLPPLTSKDGASPRLLGTDDRGRDVFARMAYGFNVSMSFALILALIDYLIGIPIGAFSGYFGGKFDIVLQRFVEIWSSLPFLFIVIIIASLIRPSFLLLIGLLCLFGWIGVSLLLRAEYLREKNKDYVAAAISIGVPTRTILLKHILPNSLVPIITYFPFAIVSGITALVSLDYLGFGLPPPTPSWGEMVGLGLASINSGYWWLVLSPLAAMFLTLMLVVFVGEALREAFDPKVFSRLR